MQLHRTHLRITGLQGKEYQPPADPAFLRRGHANLTDRRQAANIGRAVAEDHDPSDADGELYYAGVIDEEANEALAQTRGGHQQARANNENAAEDARVRAAAACQRIDEIDVQDAVDAEREAELAHLKGLGRAGYWFAVILSYVATFPLDMAAATGLPLPPAAQLIVAVTLGAVTVLAAHFAGAKALELEEARQTRAEQPAHYARVRSEYLAALTAPMLVIVAVGAWRANTFADEARATGGLVTSSVAANLAFTFLSLVAFLAAFFATQSHLRVKPLREVRAKRRQNAIERDVRQIVVEVAEREQTQAQLNIEHLVEHEEKVLARIEATREKRKKRLRHTASVREHKHRRKLVHTGLRAPRPASSHNVDGRRA